MISGLCLHVNLHCDVKLHLTCTTDCSISKFPMIKKTVYRRVQNIFACFALTEFQCNFRQKIILITNKITLRT